MAKQQIINSQNKALGIYVHVPFCRSKCQYCDFYSLPRSSKTPDLMDSYVKALDTHLAEAGARAPQYEVDTVYFGGGAPSYFGPERLRQVFSTITKRFNVSKTAEVTLEANPDTITEKGCRRLLAAGFNRISIGIQNNNDQILKVLGRPHTWAQAARSVQIARYAGFDNISVDLMYGLPAQTPQQWADCLGSVIDLQPDHISCYALTLSEDVPLYQYRNMAALPNDDAQASMYLYAASTLAAYGYNQYEISNFSKRDKECQHNLKYWLGGEYMGFGPSASSDFAGTRYTFVSNLGQYITAMKKGDSIITESEYLPLKERAGEYLMLRMRTIYGIEPTEYERSFLMPFAPLEHVLRFYGRRGLVRVAGGHWFFTPKGFLVSNQLIGALIDAQNSSTPLSPHRF